MTESPTAIDTAISAALAAIEELDQTRALLQGGETRLRRGQVETPGTELGLRIGPMRAAPLPGVLGLRSWRDMMRALAEAAHDQAQLAEREIERQTSPAPAMPRDEDGRLTSTSGRCGYPTKPALPPAAAPHRLGVLAATLTGLRRIDDPGATQVDAPCPHDQSGDDAR